MAVVTELQAELLAALLNSGVSSETIIQALKVGEKQTKPAECSKLEKIVNGGSEEGTSTSPVYAVPSAAISSTDQRDGLAPMPVLETSTQSIAEQLMRNDPWHSAKIIKQYMQQHNIPQREAVETTGLNQSHLSQHLNKGTPMKTQKRMTLYKWFEAKQREVAAQYNSTSGKRLADHDMNSPHFTNSSYKRPRRNRFKWGQASTEILYQAYETQRNPSKDEREALVQACNRAECEQRGIPLEQVNNLGPNLVTESRVYNWFANRRKEEAFKVKLAMDAGTYSVSVVGPPGSSDLTSTPDSKFASTTDKLAIPITTRSLQPMLVAPSLNRVPGTDTTPRTPMPVARLPTMSLIKCEQTPSNTPPASQLTPSQVSQNTVLQRPISVAFGAMPPQILTPTQLQVITGLMPGQVVPMPHSTPNIAAQPAADVGTPAGIPSGHVTNLMLPGQLGGQPIPMHAVTLMSMTGGTSQVFYSMPGHSPVVPVSLANNTPLTTQIPVSTQLPITATAGSTAPAVQIIPQNVVAAAQNVTSVPQNAMNIQQSAPQNLLNNVHIQGQSPQQLPQISSVHGANAQLSPATGNPNQMYTHMVVPVGTPLHGQMQTQPSATVRAPLTTKPEATRPPMQLPSISQLGTQVSTTVQQRGLQQGSLSTEAKQPNSEETFVVEMKPVDQVNKGVEQELDVTRQVTDVHNAGVSTTVINGEKVLVNSNFKEATITVSEEGVVTLDSGESIDGSTLAPDVRVVVDTGK